MATQAQLTEAEAAYHKLVTGKQVVEVMIDGVTTKYTQADRRALSVYIAELKTQLGTGTSSRKAPMGVC